MIKEIFLTILSCDVYGYTVSDTRLLLSIVDKIVICLQQFLQQFLANSSIEID